MASSLSVGKIGFGLMGMTWRAVQTPDEQAFAAMKTALETGCTFWDSGEFYGTPEPTLNLDLLKRYFDKYPQDAPKIFLSVKGGMNLQTFSPDGSEEGVRKNVENILQHLGPTKKLDLFQCGRVDQKTPIETTIKALAQLVKEGKISHIGLSECSAETIRRAYAVHPITAVEIEYSLWSTEAETNGVLETCKELGISVIAYSPLGRGFLTGELKKVRTFSSSAEDSAYITKTFLSSQPEDLPENDLRRRFDRFQPENWGNNIQLVDQLSAFAKKRGCTPAQLALAWVLAQGDNIIPIPGATSKERVAENAKANEIQLSKEELAGIRDILNKVEVKGGRYNKQLDAKFTLWG
ncbi:unnamed protein product [Didymodactylos carnosus]|uniref:NADP-dependent oxidoreductase domain-containing protein n=1 Tax=Didymodactylos carnosus TaxID=1234261 RepID=A0A814YE11_9BILA|nr:unnamed protein product [Didymodactylos carnosus]CAF1227732.1 unnamed protein product [Didymodactylos carnosus]CAF1267540.1 unnamed protein product [Didymodactylos carnosus]CAF3990563.1 unnamed protein product [Didymodactylos carnosus]CAF3990580.1 unnamed protein product [Didymodactylos carnosus]